MHDGEAKPGVWCFNKQSVAFLSRKRNFFLFCIVLFTNFVLL